MTVSARVVVMERAAGGGENGLTDLLGGERAAELERMLVGRALRWAARVAGDGEVRQTSAASSGGAEPTAHVLRDVVTELFIAGPGPVLVIWPDLVTWRPSHAAGALGDLQDGCVTSFGPMFDGGFYLVAFAQPVTALLDLTDDAWRRADPIMLAVDAAREAELAIGLLQTERGLRKPADVGALLADPLLDDELRRLLS